MSRRLQFISLLAALTCSPASGQLADAAADPELSRPLTPLSSFDVEPVTPPAGDAAKPTTLRYDLQLVGLEHTGVEARFRPLSTLRDHGRKSESATQIKARADEDAALLEKLLRSEGYFDARVDQAIAAVAGEPARYKVTLTATPGVRYTLTGIVLTGPETTPPGLARAALKLQPGAPIVAADIESAEAAIKLRLPDQGYPFAAVGARDILLDDVTHGGVYTLPVTPGPRSSFGDIRLGDHAVLGADHIRTIARFRPGQPYDNRMVDDLRRALLATSLYSSVSVEPVDTGKADADSTEAVDLLVKGAKGPWRTLAGSAGYATGEGVKAEASFTNRNRFPDEGALSFDAIVGTDVQSLSTIFRRSNAGQRDRGFQLSAALANQNFAAYNAKTLTLAATLSRISTPIWQKRWTWSVGTELIGSQEKNFDDSLLTDQNRTYLIAALPMQIGYDSTDSLLDPTRGFRVTERNSPELSFQNSVFGYDRNLIEVSGYQPVGGSVVLAGRIRSGSIFGASTDRIAPTRRIYAGGGGSVRGFGYQQLGPKDVNDDPIGGRSSIEFAAEVRYRFGVYGIVPFLDGGQVYDASVPTLAHLRYGAGIGFRYYTNFGPLRFDVATPIARQPGEAKVAIYISIGQAF
ncbi:MAG: autotransporter assembly complex protein TamA [Janthinobacterium lividum]